MIRQPRLNRATRTQIWRRCLRTSISNGCARDPIRSRIRIVSNFAANTGSINSLRLYRLGTCCTRMRWCLRRRLLSNPAPGTGPYPDAFRLRAVYGDFAMATDHTNFKTADKDGKLAFTSNSKVLRLFVKENGTWRPAAAGLVPIIVSPVPPRPGKHSATPHKSPDEQLEKVLAEADRAWMDSSDLNKRLATISKLFTDQWFEILGWDPTRNTSKSMVLEVLPKLASTNKPGEGVVADQFQLQAVFGDVALASDRRTRTWTDETGHLVKTPHRTLLVFVKQNGEWKSAGASLTPILIP